MVRTIIAKQIKRMIGGNDGSFGTFREIRDYIHEYEIFGATLRYMKILIEDGFESTEVYEDMLSHFEGMETPTVAVKARTTGCTSLAVSYLLAKAVLEKKYNAWYFCLNGNECAHVRYLFSKLIANVTENGESLLFTVSGNEFTIKNNLNGNTICIISVCRKRSMTDLPKPDTVVYDEMAYFDTSALNEKMQMVCNIAEKSGKRIKEICISTLTEKGSVFNFIAEVFGHIKINWMDFPKRFGLNTVFKREVCGVASSLKVDDSILAEVLRNKAFMHQLAEEGWEVTSDWREMYRKQLPEECFRVEIDAETETERDERIGRHAHTYETVFVTDDGWNEIK